MTMPAVVLTDEGRIALQDRPRPTLRSDQVLIEVDMCGICGSDLHASQLPQVYRDRDRADNLVDPASQDVPVVGQPLLQMSAVCAPSSFPAVRESGDASPACCVARFTHGSLSVSLAAFGPAPMNHEQPCVSDGRTHPQGGKSGACWPSNC
jgi:hypothetical protein